ncbi:hypothetical protein BC829DRAFT_225619 [Chytridium lagenaria]|nr:hypothetical protein BC829DRAFT_225619 [Chytridium lagenaria]
MVGLVIGKGGENMKRIEKDAGVKIQFSQDQSPNDPERRTTIMGPEDGIKIAKDLISEIIDGTSRRPDAPTSSSSDYSAPTGHYGPRSTSGPGQTTFPLEVPASKVGLVIGRSGETIKSLQERSGAKIGVVQDQDSKSATRTVNLTGSADAIEKAKAFIMELVSGGAGKPYGGAPNGYEGGDFEELKIPNDRVGLVIGKGGEAIKSIQGMFNVRVVIDQTPNMNNERGIKVYGNKDDIIRAVEAIVEKTMRMKGGGAGGPQSGGGYNNYNNYGNDGGSNYNAQDYGQQQQQPAAAYWDPSAYSYDQSAYYGQAQAQTQQDQGGAGDPAANAAAWEAYYNYYSQYAAQGMPADGSADSANK